jgi:hypothetical protein
MKVPAGRIGILMGLAFFPPSPQGQHKHTRRPHRPLNRRLRALSFPLIFIWGRQARHLDLVDIVVAHGKGYISGDIGFGRRMLRQRLVLADLVLAMQGVDGLATGSAVV